jgi:hypothetical protein
MTHLSVKRLPSVLVAFSFFVTILAGCENAKREPSSGGVPSDTATAQPGEQAQPAPRRVPSDTLASDRIITPGTGIGNTFLEESPDTLRAILGKPDLSDAAMGKVWLTWFGKKRDEHNNRTQVDVFLTYRDSTMSDRVVRQIRTTSSWFRLEDSLHVYSDFSSMRNAFPGLRYVGKYSSGARELKIYDDLAKGVAFETVTAAGQTLCTAILVHVPGTPLSSVFFPIGDVGVKR